MKSIFKSWILAKINTRKIFEKSDIGENEYSHDIQYYQWAKINTRENVYL